MAEEITLKKDPKKHIEERNQVPPVVIQLTRKMFKGETLVNGCQLHYDTAFGINSNPISNQVQVVGESTRCTHLEYSVFIIGNIIVVRDLLDKTERFVSKEGRFSNVTALLSVYK